MALITYCNYIATIKFSLNPTDLAPTILYVTINNIKYPATPGPDINNTGVLATNSYYYVKSGTAIYLGADYDAGEIFQTGGTTTFTGTGILGLVTGFVVYPQFDAFEVWLNGLGLGIFYFTYLPTCVVISSYQNSNTIILFGTPTGTIKSYLVSYREGGATNFRMMTYDPEAFTVGIPISYITGAVWVCEEDTGIIQGYAPRESGITSDFNKFAFIDVGSFVTATAIANPSVLNFDNASRGLFIGNNANGWFTFMYLGALNGHIILTHTSATAPIPTIGEVFSGDTSTTVAVVVSIISPTQTELKWILNYGGVVFKRFLDGETITGSSSGVAFTQVTAPQPDVDETIAADAIAIDLDNTIVLSIGSDLPDTYHRMIEMDMLTYPTWSMQLVLSPNKITILNSNVPTISTNNYWLSDGATGGQRVRIAELFGVGKQLNDICKVNEFRFAVTTKLSLVIINNYPQIPTVADKWTLRAETTPAGTVDLRGLVSNTDGTGTYILVCDYANDRVMRFTDEGILDNPVFISIEKPTEISIHNDEWIIVSNEGTTSKCSAFSPDGILYKEFSTSEINDTPEYLYPVLIVNYLYMGYTRAASATDALGLITETVTQHLGVDEVDCFTEDVIDNQYCDYVSSLAAAQASDLLFGVIIASVLYTPPVQYPLSDQVNIEAWLKSLDPLSFSVGLTYTVTGIPTLVEINTNTDWGYFVYLDLSDSSNQVFVSFTPINCAVRVPGCTSSLASNYNPLANFDDGSCIYDYGLPKRGCTDQSALNYDPLAVINDNTCVYPLEDEVDQLCCCAAEMGYRKAKSERLGEKQSCCDDLHLWYVQFAVEILKDYIKLGTQYRFEWIFDPLTSKYVSTPVTMDAEHLCFDLVTRDQILANAQQLCEGCCDGNTRLLDNL